MREHWRNQRRDVERPRLNLVRGADGRLRQADADDITDIWTEQKRIRQTEAVVKDARPITDRVQPNERPPQKAVAPRPPRFKMPQLPHLSPTRLRRFMRKKYLFVATGVVILVVSVIGFNSIGQEQDKAAQQTPTPTPDVLDITDTKVPAFDTVLPMGKSIQDLGGWVRVSPQDKAPVFAFVDKVGEVRLNISQQQLPESLQTNTAQEVAKLAEGFAANEKIVAGSITAYLGTSIHGPQSVIFTKDDLLVLIKSSGSLTTEQWTAYISSLD